ncbi:hypothetical protein [Brevundimonas sp.]|uniref:hypothetical protein n=1 Tax=Brevundimonas sp. TaxID=1871086 RepID=UPI002D4D804C|nr:hypothetical protein [Brevundimonas sp.]HYC66690.1 hypothetical protein [Brevundimonas sp.]
MTDKLTDEKLAEWESLAKAATPGPWEPVGLPYDGYDDPEIVTADGLYVAQTAYDMQSATTERDVDADTRHIAFNNPAFALSAIAEIHRLRGERDEAVKLLRPFAKASDKLHSGYDDGIAAGDHPMSRVFVADLREARAFLAKLEERG